MGLYLPWWLFLTASQDMTWANYVNFRSSGAQGWGGAASGLLWWCANLLCATEARHSSCKPVIWNSHVTSSGFEFPRYVDLPPSSVFSKASYTDLHCSSHQSAILIMADIFSQHLSYFTGFQVLRWVASNYLIIWVSFFSSASDSVLSFMYVKGKWTGKRFLPLFY